LFGTKGSNHQKREYQHRAYIEKEKVMRTTILLRLPEGFPPPEPGLDSDDLVLFDITNDDIAELIVRILVTSVDLGYVTTPLLPPPNLDTT
jgi:hypothetical protein